MHAHNGNISPQPAYGGLQKSLQQEWLLVQSVVEGIGEEFTNVQKAITECFLSALFRDYLDENDNVRLLLYSLPVEHADMALPDPNNLRRQIMKLLLAL